MKKAVQIIPFCGLLLAGVASADQIVKPHTFSAGTPASAEQVNADFDTLYGQVNKVGAAVTVDGSNNVGIGTATPTARLEVAAPPVDVYSAWANYVPCPNCMDTCNGDTFGEYACPEGVRLQCEDLRNPDGNSPESRLVECDKIQPAAAFGGDVAMSGGKLTVAALALPSGAADGAVLTADANGNASWQAAPVSSYALRAGEADNALALNGQTASEFAAASHGHSDLAALSLTGNLTLPASNPAIMAGASRLLSSGSGGNFFSGLNSGNLTMTGTSNTALGSLALAANTTGTYNTGSGQEALNRNTEGNQNTASGYRALVFNTSGSANTAAGYMSLYANSNGNGNTATGAGALQANVGGMQNTALGFYAGLTENGANANVSGSFNTFVGTQSGPGSTSQLSNATAIGYRAHVSQSNSLVLGGTGAQAVKVGIGTQAPSQALEVIGTVKADKFIGSGTTGGLTTRASVSVEPSGTAPGNTGELRMQELAAGGVNFVGFKAPDDLAGDRIWTLPAADGVANQALTTDGAGNLGWHDLGSGSQAVTGTDLNGVIRGTNSATTSLGYLGGAHGVYGEAVGNNSAGVYGQNNNPDGSGNVGYGVKGQGATTSGMLASNGITWTYDCNCYDDDSGYWVCETCTGVQPGAGVYGQAAAPAYAGRFVGNVGVDGALNITGPAGGSAQIVEGGDPAYKVFVVQGAWNQLANLQEWQANSNGGVVASVSRTGVFTGNGSGLYNVTASNLSTNCAEGQVLKKVGNTWQCSEVLNNCAEEQILVEIGGEWQCGARGLLTESDPEVGANTLNFVPKWNGSSLVSGSIHDNGNIGIGTAAPTEKLHVLGNFLVTEAGGERVMGVTPSYVAIGGNSGGNPVNFQIMDATINDSALLFNASTAALYIGSGSTATPGDGGSIYVFNSDGRTGASIDGAAGQMVLGYGSTSTLGSGGSLLVTNSDGRNGASILGEEGQMILGYGSSAAPGNAGNLYVRNSAGAYTITMDGATGTTTTKVLTITGGADLSEQFEVNFPENHILPAPGMLVSIDPDHPGQLMLCTTKYDRKVAGIISGAGGIKTGMMMGQTDSIANGTNAIALTGRVYAWADASNGAIEPGDLLTTSDVPGHAMKVQEFSSAQGAIIGKAMTSLKDGRGLVLALVSLQ